MKVLVCGATGFIGEAIAARLERSGHQVVRGVRRATRPGEIAIDYSRDLKPEQWLDKLADVHVDAVVNAVGILVERDEQTFERVHTQAPIALFTACRSKGVKQVVQLSALGAESRETRYFASKCAADDFLLAQTIQAYVVRPALVYGTAGTSALFFRTIASLPVHFLPAGGRQPLRPVHIDDLAELVARLLDSVTTMASRSPIEVVGNTEATYREMLGVYRRSMGLPPAFSVAIPASMMRAAAVACGWFRSSTLTPDTWQMLQRGNTADVGQTTEILGRSPRGIETFIEADVASSLRADAFAAWRGVLLRVALAIVWIATAIVSAALYPRASSLALLGRLNLHGLIADVALYGACALDFGFGLATLAWPTRALWLAQMVVIIAYSAAIAVALPEYLIEPFGPILKNLPILAMLFVLFSEETQP
jgi:uncharacterized protein YbjT (DUF2867 family)